VAGTAILLLSAWDDLWPEFPALLAQHFRLVIPDLPDDDVEAAAVLHSLLEGLGGVAVPVVAAGRHRVAATQLATVDSDYVSRVLMVGAPGDATPASPAPVPQISLPRKLSADSAFDAALRFLKVPGDVRHG
jgi:hypothetical protein